MIYAVLYFYSSAKGMDINVSYIKYKQEKPNVLILTQKNCIFDAKKTSICHAAK